MASLTLTDECGQKHSSAHLWLVAILSSILIWLPPWGSLHAWSADLYYLRAYGRGRHGDGRLFWAGTDWPRALGRVLAEMIRDVLGHLVGRGLYRWRLDEVP